MVLIVQNLASVTSVVETTYMDVWVSIPGLLICGVYHQWVVADEKAELEAFHTR